MKRMIDITVDPAIGCPIDVLWLTAELERALALLPGRVDHVELHIVNDERMSELHGRCLGDPATTDVLSFDLGDVGGSIEPQLVVCADVAGREAAARQSTLERELLLYAIHGLLHCVGFDDTSDAAAATMQAEQERILGQLARS